MLLKCLYCDAVSPEGEWRESEVFCDDCGSHASMVCPKCDEHIDMVFHDRDELEAPDGAEQA